MQKVISLDIGSYSIKAIEIINTLSSYEIVNFYEKKLDYSSGTSYDDVVGQGLIDLFNINKLDPDRIVTAFSGRFISSRILSFNFADIKKISIAALSLVEDSVPFCLDDVIVDYQILNKDEQSRTFVLVVMAKKIFLRGFLDVLQKVNIDPKIIDVDSLAFYNLSVYLPIDPQEGCAIIDIGHEKTSICITKGNELKMFRSIGIGGRYITEFLSRDLEISYEDAQNIKHRISRVICSEDDCSDLSEQDRTIAERMSLASYPIIKEIGRTFYAFKSIEKQKHPINKIYISGGTSQIKNFDKLMYDQLVIPTYHYFFDQTELKIKPGLVQYSSIISQAVSVGLRTISSNKKKLQINLRRGEFAYVQGYERLLKGVSVGLKVAALIVFVLMLNYGIKAYVYNKHINKLQEQYKKEYFSLITSPTFKKQLTRIRDFKVLKKKAEENLKNQIQSMKKSIDAWIIENSTSPALVILKELSEVIPKDVKIDVTLYEVKISETQDVQLVLRAETDGYTSQQKIIDAIKTASNLANIVEKDSKAKPGTNNKVIEFTISADYTGLNKKG